MPPLHLPPDEFRAFALRVAAASADLVSTLDERRTLSATSGAATARTFDQPLPEEGIGEAVFDDLAVIAAHARASTGRLFP
jgi:hypothetical protein